ncbi:unnamed protein product [Chondrus crispus]|uniref:Uncharacterized protein n=1 Tax=Chondrus crispus TaxID=2769 RepID=R7Q9M8_CHOCR|nr:unnamed protein product [Chondrus crispus]CDF34769.1 unnamed protein product [Chondrus crispus]|eukprot:XP_005714588.1 unnamed protein product [Chondrus crispus]
MVQVRKSVLKSHLSPTTAPCKCNAITTIPF